MYMYILCIFCITKDKERTDSSVDLSQSKTNIKVDIQKYRLLIY